MKVDYIELCGFRGFRDKIRVDFGAGFTVITGRNGVGKSTLCDAIEFAVLGEIGKYSVESAAQETVKDYIWWRGEGTPQAYFVTAAFSDDAGKQFIVKRTREDGADKTNDELIEALCQGAMPEDPLRQLCKTTIIRDEWIAALSLDLKETERFELVRAALGSVEGADLAGKAKSVVNVAELSFKRAEESYEQARTQLSGGLVQLSEASDAAAKVTDISAAMSTLDAIVPADPAEDLAQRLYRARRSLHDRRRSLEGVGEAVFEIREVSRLRANYESSAAVERRASLFEARAAAQAVVERLQAELELASKAYEVEARGSEIAASLSALVEHGESVSLHEGHCPLCDAIRSKDEFARGVALARERIDSLAHGVNTARLTLNVARESKADAEAAFSVADAAWCADAESGAAIQSRQEAQTALLQRHGLDAQLASDPDQLESDLAKERDRLVDIERALNALEASQSVGRLTSIDAKVVELRRQVNSEADLLARAQAALTSAKSLEKSVRRSAGEIVDERLALISPLLNEIYQRLRPHTDWRSIEYSIRGDVRRFLSLKVGNDLNPQFVFSSGQRRAAGLAFLLSVHLARSWTQWTTLVLDDPVQHIDDFRALHLVEVLSSIRQGGRQIIVAVEDEALADLLCRRLLSSDAQSGRRVTIDIGPKGAASVTGLIEIAPLKVGVLRDTDSTQQVS